MAITFLEDLTVDGILTVGSETSDDWSKGYDRSVTKIAVSGTTTKTFTLTKEDGNTLTTSWTDSEGTNNYLNSASFNTGNGVLTLGRSGLSALTVDLDGRYVTSSGVTSVATTNGITGGTITGTGTIQLDSTVIRTTGNQTIGGTKTFNTTTNGTLWEEWWRNGTGRTGEFQKRTRSDAQTESVFPPTVTLA